MRPPRSFAARLALVACLAFLLRAFVAWDAQEIYRAPADDAWLRGAPDAVRADRRPDGPYTPHDYGYAMVMGTDMPKHVRYARLVLRGDLLAENATISPLAPLAVLPLLLLLAGGSLAGAMVLQGALGAATVALTGLVARRYLSEGAALLAAGLAALYGPFVLYDILPLTESTINAAALLGILLYLRMRERPTWRRAALFGLAAGLAVAAKPTLVVLPACLLLGDAVERGIRALRPLLPRLLLALGVALLVVAPFVARARLLTGEWLFLRGNTAYMMLMGNNPAANGTYVDPPPATRARLDDLRAEDPDSLALQDRAALRLVLDWWRREPWDAVRLTAWKTALYLWPEDIPNNVSPVYLRQTTGLGLPLFLTPAVLWPLAGLGAVVHLRHARRAGIPLAFVLGYSALIILTIVVGRLRLPVLPFACMSAAAGLARLHNGGRRLDAARWRAVAAVGGLLLLTHGEMLGRELAPLLSPDGRRDALGGGVILRDGPWRQRFPYGVTLEGAPAADTADAPVAARKGIRVSLPEGPPPRRAEIWFWADHADRAEVLLTVNGNELPIRMGRRLTPEPPGRAAFLTRVPIPLRWITPEMEIRLHPLGTDWIRLFMDASPRYGRSGVTDTETGGEEDWQPPADPRTAHVYRHAHLPRGEFQIGLWFAFEGAAGPPGPRDGPRGP